MEFFNSLNLTQIKGGTKLKQGDLGSVLSYSLTDENGQEITSFDNKTAYINLVLDDKIWFTTTTLVDISRVTFRIDKAIPIGLYYLEIKIDDYIFPSDRDSIILIEEGSTPYDLKELVPNYDINMTIKGILSDLSQKGIDISDLKTKMNAIYNNALADHAEITTARGGFETLSNRLSDINNQIKNVTSGSPKGVYPNLAALQAAKPNGDSAIYVTTDNGHWYYYNNGWKDGGVYQATGIADGSVTTEKTNFVKSVYNLFDKDSVENDYYYYQQSSTGKIIKSIVNTDYRLFDKIKIVKGTRYFVSMPDLGRFAFVTDINEINLGLLRDFAASGSFVAESDGYIFISASKSIPLDTFMVTNDVKIDTFYPFGLIYNTIDKFKSPEDLDEKILRVGANREFKTIKSAIATLSEDSVATIMVDEGTYEEHSINLYDGVSIIGNTTDNSKVIIKGKLPKTSSDSAITATSTIDCKKGGVLKNLTVTAQNMRYAMHPESANTYKNWKLEVENCRFYHFLNQEVIDYRKANGLDYSNVWKNEKPVAMGLSSGSISIFKNCEFVSDKFEMAAFSAHNNANFEKKCRVELKNCKLINNKAEGVAVLAEGLNSGTEDIFRIENCVVNGRYQNTNSLSFNMLVTGCPLRKYSSTDYFKKNSIPTFTEFFEHYVADEDLTGGQFVTLQANGKIKITKSTDDVRLILGYVVCPALKNQIATIMPKGYYRLVGGYNFGDLLGVNDNGLPVVTTDRNKAVAIGDLGGFIKLLDS